MNVFVKLADIFRTQLTNRNVFLTLLVIHCLKFITQIIIHVVVIVQVDTNKIKRTQHSAYYSLIVISKLKFIIQIITHVVVKMDT
jgi:hypothetical protein